MIHTSEASSSAHLVPVVGKLYKNKYHKESDYPETGSPKYKCEWSGESFHVFSWGEGKTRAEFVMDNSQVNHWEEYVEPRIYTRWLVWWNYHNDSIFHQPNTAMLIDEARVEIYQKEYKVYKVEKVTLEIK